MISNADLLTYLKGLFGDDCHDGKDNQMKYYGRDENLYFQAKPFAIVFVRNIKQLQKLILFANEHKIALTPSGGRTGLSGGACANNGEVIVSFSYMNRILDFNPTDRLVTCEAGVITQTLQDYAVQQGLSYPVDLASAGSCQIGGNIATNAGGIKVIHYGMTRDQVAGLTVVTGKGDVLELNHGLIKNATGYDLRQLFIGSEGTLGFIVKAQMTLVAPCHNIQLVLFAVSSVSNMMKLLDYCRLSLTITAFEFFTQIALQHVLDPHGLKSPLDVESPFYVLMEFHGVTGQPMESQLDLFEKAFDKNWVQDAVLANNIHQFNELWRLREDISASLAPLKPYKNDLSVLPSNIPSFMQKIENAVTTLYPQFTVIWYGHIGDGNLHLNILKPTSMSQEQFLLHCEKSNRVIYQIVQSFSGSISAEHGLGLQKRNCLHYSKSEAEIDIMRGVKKVFDPNNIMNPGKMLPD